MRIPLNLLYSHDEMKTKIRKFDDYWAYNLKFQKVHKKEMSVNV